MVQGGARWCKVVQAQKDSNSCENKILDQSGLFWTILKVGGARWCKLNKTQIRVKISF